MFAGLFHYIDGVNFNGAGLLEIDLNSSDQRILDSLSWHIGNNQVRSFYCSGQDTLVGTGYGLFFNRDSLFRTAESGVEEIDRTLHADLQQNYPNPFNPATLITYSIDHAGPVILDIYDLNGELIRRMVNENQLPGDYSYRFNAHDLPAGIYVYRLQTGTVTLSRKMVLLK